MYEFLEKVSNLGPNVFACLLAITGREAFAVLEKPGGFRQGGLRQKAQGPGYHLVPRGAPGFISWSVGRVTERGFLLSESAYFLCRTALARHTLQA